MKKLIGIIFMVFALSGCDTNDLLEELENILEEANTEEVR